ncbi:centromere protein Q [Scleropages formosus]|nr:centromere protein Q [Scleropages formosus]
MKTGRATSLAPGRKGRGSTRLQESSHVRSDQEAGPSGRVSQQRQRKRTGTQVASRTVRGRKTWKRLSEESVAALESMLTVSVLSVLTMKRKDREECQRHLNVLKDRFMANCANLVAPPRKPGSLQQSSRLHQEESRKSETGRRSLEALEAEVGAVLQLLEHTEGRLETLEQESKSLRSKLEQQEEQESVQQVLRQADQGVLHLPQLPAGSGQERPLQEQMANMVPEPGAAACLGRALCGSAEVQEVLLFLERGHEQADRLLRSPAPSPAHSGSPREHGGSE